MRDFDKGMEASQKYFGEDTQLAANVFITKYALEDNDGNLLELDPDVMHKRLAREFWRVENNYKSSMKYEDIYPLFSKFRYVIPQGSPMSGIGNNFKIQSISNCFVIGSPVDSYGGILKTDEEQVQIMKRRGGVGTDISHIRPKNMPTSNAAKTSSGIEAFMERYSNSTREVAQEGRRGALMLTISVHHPQIIDFIRAKHDLKKVTGANISVRVTDEFMIALRDGQQFQLRYPVDAKYPAYSLMVDPKEIWKELINSAHQTAEPGVLFWDTATRMTPSDIYRDFGFGSTSTNPCVTGDTLVRTVNGDVAISNLIDSGNTSFDVVSYNIWKNEIETKTCVLYKTKENAELLQVETSGGKKIKLTSDHKVFTSDSWKFARDLVPNKDSILSIGETLTSWEKVIKISKAANETVYDLTVDDNHNFFANGLLVHNCGEIILCPYDSCRLLLMNLANYVVNPWKKNARFDIELFRRHVFIAQRLMDDMVDLELEQIDKILAKIEKDPEADDIKRREKELWTKIKEVALMGRRTGLGITALADCLAMLGIRYASPDSVRMTEFIYSELAKASHFSSLVMAKERGAFKIFDYSLEEGHPFLERVMSALEKDPFYNENLRLDLLSPREAWKKWGRRNIANLTTAPAGSVSLLADNGGKPGTSSGFDPVFNLSHKRRKKINPNDKVTKVDFVDEMGDKWIEFNVFHPGFERWMKESGNYNPEISVEENIKLSPYHLSQANEIDWRAKIEMQAAAQRWIDHAISNTLNLPADVDVSVVNDVYFKGWELGVKGVTVYRDGSRSGVLIENKKEEKTNKTQFVENQAPKRPEELECDIHHARISGESWTVIVGLLDGKPYEIMGGKNTENRHLKCPPVPEIPKSVTKGTLAKEKRGNSTSYTLRYTPNVKLGKEVVIEKIEEAFNNINYSGYTRMISLSLRHGVPVRFIVEQLQKDKEADIFSFSKVIARCLKKYIVDGKINDKKCKSCGSQSLVYQEGCVTCMNCGDSKCS